MVKLPESDEDLLRECEIDTFRASGPGGQHVNKTESAVRLRHLPSGIVVTARQERSQHQNKALCLRKLRKKVEQLNHQPATRIPTRIPRGVKNRTLEEKARRFYDLERLWRESKRVTLPAGLADAAGGSLRSES